MVIKVAASGDIYMDGRLVSAEELTASLAAVKERGEAVTYYRESPRSDPTAAANDVFRRVMEARVNIRLGHQAPSEWGTLDWVEIEESPHRSRFFMARGQQFLIAYREVGADPGADPVTYVGGPLSEDTEERWLSQIDLLVRSDRVMETPPSDGRLCFDPEALKRPGVHIRVGYGPEQRWASHYEIEVVPPNLRAFQEDVARVAHHLVASTDKDSWQKVEAVDG